MKRINLLLAALSLLIGQAFLGFAFADTFGSGANWFEIEFVTIGSPGNPPDTTDRPVTDGAVPYEYRIGKFEISEQLIDKVNGESARAGSPLNIPHEGRGPNMPATSVSWFEAAKFVNWLNTSSGHTAAYKFDDAGNFQLWEPDDPGYNPQNLYRNRKAFYFLPSLSEWHKAAYFDPIAGVYYDYPTGSDVIPDGINFAGDPDFDAVFFDGGANADPNIVMDVGLLSPSGTAGQGGNVREWLETAFDRMSDEPNEHRFARGGSKSDTFTAMAASASGIGTAPAFNSPIHGFRVASVIPEPHSLVLVGLAVLGALRLRCAKRKPARH